MSSTQAQSVETEYLREDANSANRLELIKVVETTSVEGATVTLQWPDGTIAIVSAALSGKPNNDINPILELGSNVATTANRVRTSS